MIDKDKVIALLGNGLGPQIVANTVGCDISYISQLLSDEGIAQQVSQLRTADVVKYKEMDDGLDNIEKKLIQKLDDLIPFFTRPRDILNALQVVNAAKRRSVGMANPVETGVAVKLTLPSVVINNIKINVNNNMVEVGGRDITPMPSDILYKTLEARKEGAQNAEQKFLSPPPKDKLPTRKVINESSV